MSQNPWAPTHGRSLSNNPFIDDPNAAHNRYPSLQNLDTAGGGSASPYGSPAGYQNPQATGFYAGAGAPSSTFGGYAQAQPAPAQQLGFQPTGYFGQPAPQPQSPISSYSSQQFTGSPYAGSPYGAAPAGYGSGFLSQPQFQQQQQWQPQPSNRPPPHLQDLDPYSGLSSQGFGGPSQQQQQQPQPGSSYLGAGTGTSGSASPLPPPRAEEHPRTWIRSHREELETWDPTSWRQALIRFDELQTHWERRKIDLQARVDATQRGYLPQHEAPHWQNLLKEADSNIDSVAASKLQMQEALTGYKQSSDIASKRRVKEMLNAGLLGLPEFPPQL
ncbi:hypothetical protein EXIGLDRAFT_837718 [Exidia glandulosa HHB12029]|uniref:Uncharacterized protein n=1 Tax=Exidia glandulosa HHB12029 TaxID=1314781 RepID=A0A165GI41_EXIGL|nr:hypothetical protein EXIGLDRAFT_837718 [Exidia glandulosa HHB12029]